MLARSESSRLAYLLTGRKHVVRMKNALALVSYAILTLNIHHDAVLAHARANLIA